MSAADARAEIAELYSRDAWALNDRDRAAWEVSTSKPIKSRQWLPSNHQRV